MIWSDRHDGILYILTYLLLKQEVRESACCSAWLMWTAYSILDTPHTQQIYNSSLAKNHTKYNESL